MGLPWEVQLLRLLQSWQDSALVTSHRMSIQEECSACTTDLVLSRLISSRPWPHWLRHDLRERLLHLRGDVFLEELDIPFDHHMTYGDHFRRRDQSGRSSAGADHSAVQHVDDLMRCFDMWLCHRVGDLAPWEGRVFKRMPWVACGKTEVDWTLASWIVRVRTSRVRATPQPHDSCIPCDLFGTQYPSVLPGQIDPAALHDLTLALYPLMMALGYNLEAGKVVDGDIQDADFVSCIPWVRERNWEIRGLIRAAVEPHSGEITQFVKAITAPSLF